MATNASDNMPELLYKLSTAGANTVPTAVVPIITAVPVTTQSVVVLAANPNRKGLVIYNNSANSVYMRFDVTVTGATCTRILATYAQWDMVGPTVYQGPIAAIRNSGSGNLIITELV